MYLVAKKSKRSPKNYPQLKPNRKCCILRKMPEDWEEWIPAKFGSGEYLITMHGTGTIVSTFFHGYLEKRMGI